MNRREFALALPAVVAAIIVPRVPAPEIMCRTEIDPDEPGTVNVYYYEPPSPSVMYHTREGYVWVNVSAD